MSQNNHWEESRKTYHPTLICVPATEWEQMNEEIKELREQKQATIKFDAQKCLKEMIAHWNRREAEMRGPMDKPYTFQMQNKHDPTVSVDIGGKVPVVMPESMYRRMQEMHEPMPEGEALKAAVDAGKVIVDGKGNEIWKDGDLYVHTHNGKQLARGKWNRVYWWQRWRIKPEPPNYPLLLAELGMGKMLRSEDGYDLSWSRYTDCLTLYKGGMPTGIYTWNNVVEQVLEKHKGWRVV